MPNLRSFFWGLFIGAFASALPAAEPLHKKPLLRQPIAIEVVDDDARLLAANRKSGTLSLVDLAAQEVEAEFPLGQKLADMALLDGGRRLLVVDEAAHELIVAKREGKSLQVVQRLPVVPTPVNVVTSADEQHCFVTGLWSRQLALVSLASGEARVKHTLDLPFAPREQVVLPDGRLLVADAFGGRLLLIDVAEAKIVGQHELPAHNMRGLAVSTNERKLLVAQQILNSLAETSQNDVHWGILMVNVLRWLRLDHFDEEQPDLLAGSHVHPAGDQAVAGGDPAEVRLTPNGTAVMALAGVDFVAVGSESDFTLQRVPVERRPTAVAIDSTGSTAYVANTLADSISVIDIEPARNIGRISLGPRPELSDVDRGESLFYDARLSMDGWFSCHSCHVDGHTNDMLNDNMGDGSFGAAKRVLSLLGSAHTGPWAWNGTVEQLEDQVAKSVETTMQGQRLTTRKRDALTAYLRTLEPPPSHRRLTGRFDAAAAERGEALFSSLGCAECHRPPTYTTPAAYDVGIHDRRGNREFNPPSLLGVGQRGPYFHDSRAATLEDVLSEQKHQLPRELEKQELHDLLEFLRGL